MLLPNSSVSSGKQETIWNDTEMMNRLHSVCRHPVTSRLPGTKWTWSVGSRKWITIFRRYQENFLGNDTQDIFVGHVGRQVNIMPFLSHNSTQQQWKKCSERRKHCAPCRRPLPGGAGRPKFNQLEMVTTFTHKPSLLRIDARNFELSW